MQSQKWRKERGFSLFIHCSSNDPFLLQYCILSKCNNPYIIHLSNEYTYLWVLTRFLFKCGNYHLVQSTGQSTLYHKSGNFCDDLVFEVIFYIAKYSIVCGYSGSFFLSPLFDIIITLIQGFVIWINMRYIC